jgi:predicted LPLAT superfamily acyltransferase
MVDWVPTSAPDIPIDTVQLLGLEHLDAALAKGNGVILWESKGFGRRTLSKRVLHAKGYRVTQLHGVSDIGVVMTDETGGTWLRSRVLRPIFDRRERSFVADVLPVRRVATISDSRAYVSVLRGNGIICVAGDGKIARTLHALEFLGGTTMFAPGMVKLAGMTGATLLPMFCVPTDKGGAVLEISPPIAVPESGDLDRATENALRRFAGALEAHIRLRPECFRNWHLIRLAPHGVAIKTPRRVLTVGDEQRGP